MRDTRHIELTSISGRKNNLTKERSIAFETMGNGWNELSEKDENRVTRCGRVTSDESKGSRCST